MNVDLAKSKLATEYKHETPLLSCAFDSTGRFLFAGGRDRNLVLVTIKDNQKTLLKGHDSWVGVAHRASEELVLTGDYVGRVIAWDCNGDKPTERWSIEAHSSTIYGLSVSADGKSFTTSDRDGFVRIWQSSDGKRLFELPQNEFPVYGVSLHPDGKRIVTADRQPQKPRLKVWTIATGKEELVVEVAELSGYRRVEDIEWGGIRGLTVSPDGEQIIACGRNGYDGQACALVYDTNSGKLQRKLAEALKGGFYYSAKFHPQGFLMTSGGDLSKGELRAWNTRHGISLGNIATSGPCTAFDIHPEGLQLATAQGIGKASYPDSGSLAIYDFTP